MIRLTDTHTHLYLPEFDSDGRGAVERAIAAGIGRMIFPNVDLTTIAPMRKLALDYPDYISMAMGLHPSEVKENWQDDTSAVISELESNRADYVAVGEIGIDMYWDKTYEREQMLAFDRQVGIAEESDLPVIIHCRDGLDQTLEVLEGHKRARAVFHSFGGTVADVDRIRRVGDYYFGINGIVTFKNCKVRDSLEEITLGRLLLETDSPYLAPVPHRGKRNESAYLIHTAHHIASHLGVEVDNVADITNVNARTLFGVGYPDHPDS